MRVIGLDGKKYNLSLTGHFPLESDDRPRSSLHIKARNLLKEIFPFDRRLEEIFLPGSGNLYLDFYLPRKKIGIEVNGIQHYEQSSMFHETKLDFIKSNIRDDNKLKWCELNSIKLVVFSYKESLDEWRSKIINRREVDK